MLERVVRTLDDFPDVGSILVSIDAPELLDALPGLVDLRQRSRVAVARSESSPSRSVLAGLEGLGDRPVLVTTADHALLSREILDDFLGGARASGADLAVGLVGADTIRAAYPESQRTYLRFRGGAYSGANLFYFATPAAKAAAGFWRRVEHDRKQPWRMVRHFGLANLVAFGLRALDLDGAFRRASDVVGCRIRAIVLPQAEAATDVDKPSDLALVNAILARRAQEAPLPGSGSGSLSTNR